VGIALAYLSSKQTKHDPGHGNESMAISLFDKMTYHYDMSYNDTLKIDFKISLKNYCHD
jgi:hypothetical protein